MHPSLSQHRIVLDLRLPQGRGIAGDNHQLAFPITKAAQCLLVAQIVFARFHDKGQSGVDRFGRLF